MFDDEPFSSIDFGVSKMHLPVCFCIDVSGSMLKIDVDAGGFEVTEQIRETDGKKYKVVKGGTPICDYVAEGIKIFYNEIKKDDSASNSCESTIVTFNDEPTILDDFGMVYDKNAPKKSQIRRLCKGNTNLGKALMKSLEILDEKKEYYKEAHIPYQQPWLIIFSDGVSDDDCSDVIKELIKRQEKDKLTVFAIAIKKDKKLVSFLKQFTTGKVIYYNEPKKMCDVFKFLAASAVASSKKDEEKRNSEVNPWDAIDNFGLSDDGEI